MLLDAMAKVVASIVESRLARLIAKVGVEYQNAFPRWRLLGWHLLAQDGPAQAEGARAEYAGAVSRSGEGV
jgi:hypothetical protein